MPNPYDAAPDFHEPDTDREPVTMPDDYEAAGLEPGVQHIQPPDVTKRDDEALAHVERQASETDIRAREGMRDHPSMWGTTRLGGVAVGGDAEVVAVDEAKPHDGITVAGDQLEVEGEAKDTQVTDTTSAPDEIDSHFGRKAVVLADEVARAVVEEDETGEQWARQYLEAELTSIRRDFAAWEAGLQEPETDQYFEATGIVAHFNELDRPHLPVTLAGSDMAEARPEDVPAIPRQSAPESREQADADPNQQFYAWVNGLNDDQLINLLQWSDARTEAVTDAIVAQRDEIQRNVREDFGYLIEDGLAPESARVALERGFQQTNEFGAVSTFESGYYHAAGLYYGDEMRLGVKRDYEVDEADKYMRLAHRVFMHEALHGTDFANEMGLTYLMSTEEEPLTWVDEAVKEHLTLAGMNGQSYIVDPAERKDTGAYPGIRELLHLVQTAGAEELELTDFTLANFEQRGGGGTNRQALVEKLRSSYQERYPDLAPGETILHVIAKEHNAAPKPLKHEVIERWIQKMYEWRGIPVMVEDEEPSERANWSITVGG